MLHGTSPRLLSYDGIDIEAPLHGTLVAIRNHDVPGVVGRIGTILGEQRSTSPTSPWAVPRIQPGPHARIRFRRARPSP